MGRKYFLEIFAVGCVLIMALGGCSHQQNKGPSGSEKGAAHPQTGKYMKAISKQEETARSASDISERKQAHLELAHLYTSYKNPQRNYKKALKHLEMYASLEPDFAKDKDLRNWLSALKEMDSQLPHKYYVQFFLGVSYLSLNEPEMASEYLQKALALEPKREDIASIYSYLAVSLKDQERYRPAIETLQKAEQYDHERTDIQNLMGFCHFKLKEHEKAIENFKKALRLDPSSAIDYANIGSNYREMGQSESAIRYYELALELDPCIDFARENIQKLTKQ